MALSTPISITQRGYAANSGVVTTNYPHSITVNPSPIKTASLRVSGPDLTTLKGAAVAINDVFPIFPVKAGDFVLSVTAKVTTAEGGTSTFSIGDGSQTAGYISGADSNSTSTYSCSWDESPATIATVYGVGHFYSADDTVDLLVASGTLATAVIDVSVTYISTAPLAA